MSTNWEARYRANDTPWDKGAACPSLLDYLSAQSIQGHVLVPGCGFGHDVRVFANQGAEALGIDIAPAAIEGAHQLGVPKGARFQLLDLFQFPPRLLGTFDWVWEHTCFCAIDPELRPDYVRAVASALKPTGHFFAIFYLDPGNDDKGPPHGVTPAELDGLFNEQFDLLEEWKPESSFSGREGRELMRILRKKQGLEPAV